VHAWCTLQVSLYTYIYIYIYTYIHTYIHTYRLSQKRLRIYRRRLLYSEPLYVNTYLTSHKPVWLQCQETGWLCYSFPSKRILSEISEFTTSACIKYCTISLSQRNRFFNLRSKRSKAMPQTTRETDYFLFIKPSHTSCRRLTFRGKRVGWIIRRGMCLTAQSSAVISTWSVL
jgi:hypothetical protein